MTTLLIDGNNILARSAFAAKGGRTEMSVDGINTSALLIFINMLSKYVKQVGPTHLMVCWDKGHQVRDEIYPAYKSNRKPHDSDEDEAETPWHQAKQFLTFAGVPQRSLKGLEADDLIALIAMNPETPSPIVILSGDKDLLQLMGEHTTQIRPGGSGSEMWDASRIKEEMGFTPEQMPLYMSLVGDTSDCIPGVKGIGPKKATVLLDKAGWEWDALLGLLEPGQAQDAITARRLFDLRNPEFSAHSVDDVYSTVCRADEFKQTGPGSMMWESLVQFVDKWRLASVQQRLDSGDLWASSKEEPTLDGALAAFSGFDL